MQREHISTHTRTWLGPHELFAKKNPIFSRRAMFCIRILEFAANSSNFRVFQWLRSLTVLRLRCLPFGTPLTNVLVGCLPSARLSQLDEIYVVEKSYRILKLVVGIPGTWNLSNKPLARTKFSFSNKFHKNCFN